MRSSYTGFVFVCLMLFGIDDTLSAKDVADTRDKLPKSVDQRIRSVQHDLANAKDLPFWAGKFVEGDGLGMNVTLYVSPKAGVAVTNYGCMGLYGADEGQLSVQPNGGLKFAFSRQQPGAPEGFADEVVPVRWGERTYLLPPQRMFEFVLAVNRGFEQLTMPGGGMFLNNKKAIRGLPELPDPYRAALRQKAVNANVVRATPTGTRSLGEPMCQMRYDVTIDQGASSGLSIGERLAVVQPENSFEELTVERVLDAEATGTISVIEDNCTNPVGAPTVGWKLSTFAIGEIKNTKQGRSSE